MESSSNWVVIVICSLHLIVWLVLNTTSTQIDHALGGKPTQEVEFSEQQNNAHILVSRIPKKHLLKKVEDDHF